MLDCWWCSWKAAAASRWMISELEVGSSWILSDRQLVRTWTTFERWVGAVGRFGVERLPIATFD